MPVVNAKDRIGNTAVANNGQVMTVIAYRGSRDIDIRFEDGTVVYNKVYDAFLRGNIRNPNVDWAINKRVEKEIRKHVGLESVGKCGLKMTVIAYRDKNDLDVRFEDGTVVCHRTLHNFKKGMIGHPGLGKTKQGLHVGETRLNSQGQKMTVIAFRRFEDIDVRFESGAVKEHVRYNSFKEGRIKDPGYLVNKREGETNLANNGQIMTLIAYHGSEDVDVRFEDGTVVCNRAYGDFKRGAIRNPNFNAYQDRLGETAVSKTGQKMTIVEYNAAVDITVQFDDGTIVKHKRYKDFVKGLISNPNYYKNSRVGEVVTNCRGLKMTLVEYRSVGDVDVRFEDGAVAEHKAYKDFKKGVLKHPDHAKFFPQAVSPKEREGQVGVSTIGQKMVLIKYRGSGDIDVQFEDGTIVTHKHYQSFVLGTIRNPNAPRPSQITPELVNKRLGEVWISNCGLPATIIDYKGIYDVSVEYPTGAKVLHKTYKNIKAGKVGHPFPYQIGDVVMLGPAYVFNGVGNFKCICTKCNAKDILTLDEIKNYKCKSPILDPN